VLVRVEATDQVGNASSVESPLAVTVRPGEARAPSRVQIVGVESSEEQ
jgi:hypothetical protein